MWLQYFTVCFCLLAACCPIIICQYDEPERTITPCDEEIGGMMCNMKDDISKCADLMPNDEKPFFFTCGREMPLADTDKWMPLLDAICSEKEKVKKAFELTDCWDEKMSKAVDEMEDNGVYPEEHFECKKLILEKALNETKCPCQIEKRGFCNKMEMTPF